MTPDTKKLLEELKAANPGLSIPELDDPNYVQANGSTRTGRRHQPNRIEIAIPGMRQCSRCGRILSCSGPIDSIESGEYGMDKSGKEGRKSSCRICCTEASRESTARTRGLPYECKSDIEDVKTSFPSIAADKAVNEAWAKRQGQAPALAAGTKPARTSAAKSTLAPDTSPKVEADTDGLVTV